MSDRLHAFVTLVTVVTYPSSVTTGHLKSWQVSRLAPVAQSKSWACRLDFAARSNLQPGAAQKFTAPAIGTGAHSKFRKKPN
jgi:hypothetical protein